MIFLSVSLVVGNCFDIALEQIVNFSPELEFKVLDYMPMTKYEVIKLDSGVCKC